MYRKIQSTKYFVAVTHYIITTEYSTNKIPSEYFWSPPTLQTYSGHVNKDNHQFYNVQK